MIFSPADDSRQVADWPSHKPACKEARIAVDPTSSGGIAAITDQLRTDSSKYIHSIAGELCIAARTAFNFGTDWGDERHKSHVLQLNVDYEPSGTTLRERFINHKLGVLPLTELSEHRRAQLKLSEESTIDIWQEAFRDGIRTRFKEQIGFASVVCVTGFRGTPHQYLLQISEHDLALTALQTRVPKSTS